MVAHTSRAKTFHRKHLLVGAWILVAWNCIRMSFHSFRTWQLTEIHPICCWCFGSKTRTWMKYRLVYCRNLRHVMVGSQIDMICAGSRSEKSWKS
uniref:Uncharacterized protein n=1 Tax=Arundo donax TaxID=35708 RepID=A0A0A9ELP1_ARUDO